MKQKCTKLVRLFLTILLSLTVSTTAVSATNNDAEEKSDARMSTKGLYSVSFKSKVIPIPLNRIHSWTLHIETANGNAVDDAKISVFGGMPLHKHSFPTAPKVTKNLGNGDYLVEGIKFSMTGHWEVWLNIHTKKTDKVKNLKNLLTKSF